MFKLSFFSFHNHNVFFRFSISLVTGQNSPDYSNIAFQFEASFPDDQFTAKIVHYGQLTTFPVDPRPSQLIGGKLFFFY